MSDSENLDVRQLIPMERHRTIFATWQGLAAKASAIATTIPSRCYQFDAEHKGQFGWEYPSGLGQRVRIGKIG
jgi:uncharacterized protein (DUF2249 family)